MTEPHPLRCETCMIHKKVCNNLPHYYGKDSGFPSSGCLLYDSMGKEPDNADAYWEAIELVGCASHSSATDAQQRIEEVIKELELAKTDAQMRSIRAHEIEDGKWCGANMCDAPDAELKTLKKAIALLKDGVRKE